MTHVRGEQAFDVGRGDIACPGERRPQVLPDDVDYGDPWQLCLDDESRISKPLAIDAFGTQLGTVGRTPGLLPESRKGVLDCNAYLRSFGRTTEVFVVRDGRP